MEIYKYETELEAEQIIAEKKQQGYTLTHISNITEGNFLGFFNPKNFIDSLGGLVPIEEQILYETKYQTLLLEMGGM